MSVGVTVWLATTSSRLREFDTAAVKDFLAPPDLAAANRIRVRSHRERFLTRRLLVRLVLGAELGVSPAAVHIDRKCVHCGDRQHGRPVARSPAGGPSFSATAAGDYAAVALAGTGTPVGLDLVEDDGCLDLEPDILATVGLGADWRPMLDDPARLWTALEATLKAVGSGLAGPPEVVARIAPPTGSWFSPGPRYTGCVVVESGDAVRLTVRRMGWPEGAALAVTSR